MAADKASVPILPLHAELLAEICTSCTEDAFKSSRSFYWTTFYLRVPHVCAPPDRNGWPDILSFVIMTSVEMKKASSNQRNARTL